MKTKLYTDGCYFYHLNVAGIGGYIENEYGEIIHEFSEILNDNKLFNHHEIIAIKHGMNTLINLGLTNEIECYMDDRVLSEILNLKEKEDIDYYCNRNQMLVQLFEIKNQFKNIVFYYLPREKNKKADDLSRKKILETIPQKTRIVEGGLKINKLYAKEHFLKNESDNFRDIKRDINLFYVFNVYQKNNFFKIDSFLVEKNNLEYKVISNSNGEIGRFWIRDTLDYISDCIGELNEKSICIAAKSPGNLIEKILRGLEPETKQVNLSFPKLSAAINKYEKVVIHRDDQVMDMIFPKEEKEEFNELQLIILMKSLGENNKLLDMDIPEAIIATERIKYSSKKIQEKCFGEYVKIRMKKEIQEKKKAGVILRMGKLKEEETKVAKIKEELKNMGIVFVF